MGKRYDNYRLHRALDDYADSISPSRRNVSNTSSSGGTSILGLLGVAFVVLKLTGVINWSWWLVLLPFYGGLLLYIAIFLLGALGVGALFGMASLLDKRQAKKRAKARTERLKR